MRGQNERHNGAEPVVTHGLKNLEDEAGKRMDFILQEMNREVTTILSKTSGLNELGASIGQAAIEIKVEIEKLREQVQNLE